MKVHERQVILYDEQGREYLFVETWGVTVEPPDPTYCPSGATVAVLRKVEPHQRDSKQFTLDHGADAIAEARDMAHWGDL